MHNIKKLLTILLIINIICSFAAYAADNVISEEPITKGLTLKHVIRKTSSGNVALTIAEADLNEPTLHLKVLTAAGGINKTSSVKAMAENAGACLAINTDYFSWISSGIIPEGMIVSDGKVVTSPSTDSSYATLALTNDNNVIMDYFKYDINVTSKRTGQTNSILFHNKDASAMYMKLYDSSYGKYAPDSGDDSIEVVVEKGKVIKVLSNQPAVEIPADGYVLKNSLRYSLFLSENFQVGDEVELSYKVTPDVSAISEATGGGSLLVKNGAKAVYTHVVSGLQPCTALGVDKSGKKLFFVTADGRQSSSVGMTMNDMTALMLELGAYNAISFDGGGSTQMAAKLMGEKLSVVNSPSETRSVAVGLGIVADKAQGKYSYLKVTMPAEKTAAGSPVDVWIRGFDEYGNECDLSGLPVTYSTDSQGVFDGNIYYPYSVGTHTLTVKAGDVSGSIKLNVYEAASVKDISSLKGEIKLNAGVFGSQNAGNTLAANLINKNRMKAAGRNDISIFEDSSSMSLGGITLNTGAYKAQSLSGSKFITMPSSDNAYSSSQLIADLTGISEKNVFIIMPKSVADNDMLKFKHMLKQRLQGKNIFVISFGTENSIKAESGIYFASVSTLADLSLKNTESFFLRGKYLQISAGADSAACQFVSYFN